MKKILFLSAFFMLTNLFAQSNYNVGSFYEGYIIKKDGSKERGYIQYLDESSRYEKLVFKSEKKAKKQKFRPKDVGGYKVADVVYHAVQFESVPFKNQKFLVLDKEGCLNQYHYRERASDGTWTGEVVLKNDEKAISTQKFLLGFSGKMADLLNKNEEIANKVRNKEKGYSLFELEAIVDEYNAACN